METSLMKILRLATIAAALLLSLAGFVSCTPEQTAARSPHPIRAPHDSERAPIITPISTAMTNTSCITVERWNESRT